MQAASPHTDPDPTAGPPVQVYALIGHEDTNLLLSDDHGRHCLPPPHLSDLTPSPASTAKRVSNTRGRTR
jgi:hypothetical protein